MADVPKCRHFLHFANLLGDIELSAEYQSRMAEEPTAMYDAELLQGFLWIL